MISLFSFLHTGTAFMVIVQFRGRLVRHYRAYLVTNMISRLGIVIKSVWETRKLKILQIIMWNIGMAQKAKKTRSGCLVHIVQ